MNDAGKPDVSVIVVSYNTRALTLECLRSVAETTHRPYEILVVDNASADGSAAAVARAFPEARLFARDENLGFGRAVNLAAREARGRFLLLLNPDAVVLEGAIDAVLAFAEAHPEAGLYGGLTMVDEHTVDPCSYWRFPTPWTMFCRAVGLATLFPRHPWLDGEGVRVPPVGDFEVDVIAGCFLLAPRELWERLSGFDERFFMYAEDLDLCLRARALGLRPTVCRAARVVHEGAASETVESDRVVRQFVARSLFFGLHWQPLPARIGRLELALWALPRLVAHRVAGWLGRERSRAAARDWAAVWRRRPEYLHPEG